MSRKKIVFLTGTRADFGKMKSLIQILKENESDYEVNIFVTGMHLLDKYGRTVDEIYKSGFTNVFEYVNTDHALSMDLSLSKTINGFSEFIKKVNPDLIIVHGDRLEALAGSIVGSFNNILVAHIEGGEISGTLDDSIRHAVSKLSHIHFVSNEESKRRLLQLGEDDKSIFEIGSPDLDIMSSHSNDLDEVRKYYDIGFEDYAIAMFHPVISEVNNLEYNVSQFVTSLIESNQNYVVIYPNNDLSSELIIDEYEKRLRGNDKFKIFPSIRFEYFTLLLKNASFVIGNSSAGVREAPFLGVPAIDIGTRQHRRVNNANFGLISHADYDSNDILSSIDKVIKQKSEMVKEHNQSEKFYFGKGNSDKLFLDCLNSGELWKIDIQKYFQDL